jgi:hypothetical protein
MAFHFTFKPRTTADKGGGKTYDCDKIKCTKRRNFIQFKRSMTPKGIFRK